MHKLNLSSLFAVFIMTLYSVGALSAGVNNPGFQNNEGEGPPSPPFLSGKVQIGGEPAGGMGGDALCSGKIFGRDPRQCG